MQVLERSPRTRPPLPPSELQALRADKEAVILARGRGAQELALGEVLARLSGSGALRKQLLQSLAARFLGAASRRGGLRAFSWSPSNSCRPP